MDLFSFLVSREADAGSDSTAYTRFHRFMMLFFSGMCLVTAALSSVFGLPLVRVTTLAWAVFAVNELILLKRTPPPEDNG
jgi:hypothetical protein